MGRMDLHTLLGHLPKLPHNMTPPPVHAYSHLLFCKCSRWYESWHNG
ncbi:hypothetical protein M080_5533, partial [Bacteroides fragilis str. 3397 T10]